ncbi:Undecaprenyl-diphosphatase UppP [Moorella glycerini]|uniref:Undecaprenyl-diphosphatase n=1 Tax=Neomoorella stamsii TaxID=1266720 RepID=A0A9X7P7B5_9FIRM|nr:MULTISPECIES: undecaprenyl-diphosphatase UppP [Moorella]PRR76405.1 Undecaprenyl-diphosphatase [Moorella stamsii]CEP67026.1 Undecaprenyl-diphosphatase UppP [Moorella glycerini]
MNVVQAVILGLVQGLGEFLPISSSAHLVLLPWFFRWPDQGLTFDVALHLGTLIAVVAYFWRDLIELVICGLFQPRSLDGRLFWYLIVASIPGAIFGYLLEDQVGTVFRSPLLIALTLTLMGIGLWWADRVGRKTRQMEDITLADSIIVGISQALAIIPGVSRSGITMSAGLLTGMKRETAARFSFLMSVPIIAGAALLQLKDLTPAAINLPFILGVLTAAVVGFLAIKFLLQYLRYGSYLLFTWYRILLALLVVAVFWWRR